MPYQVVAESEIEGADANPDNYLVVAPSGAMEGPMTKVKAQSRCAELEAALATNNDDDDPGHPGPRPRARS